MRKLLLCFGLVMCSMVNAANMDLGKNQLEMAMKPSVPISPKLSYNQSITKVLEMNKVSVSGATYSDSLTMMTLDIIYNPKINCKSLSVFIDVQDVEGVTIVNDVYTEIFLGEIKVGKKKKHAAYVTIGGKSSEIASVEFTKAVCKK